MSISVPDASAHVLLKPLPPVTKVRTDQRRLYVELANGLEISAPLGWFPRLEGATVEQRRAYEVWPQGDVISWPEVDEDISVYGMLGLSD